MSQQINLFNPLFRKKAFSLTSSTAMLYGVGFAIVLAAGWAVHENYQLGVVQRETAKIAAAHSDATANHAALAAELAGQKPNAAVEAEVAALEARLQNRQDVIATLDGGAVGNTVGFSQYMRAFSRGNISGLWLTGFDITGTELAIQGRTLSTDLVASYLKQLNQEKSLQGRQFAALRISQPPAEPSKPLRPDPDAKVEKSASEASGRKPPRFLEFTISTIDITDNTQPSARPPEAAALLGIINASTVPAPATSGATQETAR